MRLAINGRFVSRPMTGVDRVAYGLTRALVSLCKEIDDNEVSIELLLPKLPEAALEGVPSCGSSLDVSSPGKSGGQLWEQLELPLRSSGAWTVNFCNVGPLWGSRQVVMMHDAQVYLAPSSYSLTFRLWYRFVQPIIARRASALFTVSNYSRDCLEESGVFPRGKAKVIYNGVDHLDEIQPDDSILAKENLEQGGYFLTMGSMNEHKNLRCVLQAAASNAEEVPPLVIAGGDANELAKKYTGVAPENACFIGRVSDGELKALYGNALGFVFPSITEGFGLPPMEAMHCGCPVIASSGGALPEVCGNAPLYADPSDPSEWSAAMLRLASDPNLRQQMSSTGREQTAGFTWRRSAMEMLNTIAIADGDEVLRRKINTLKD